MKMRKLHIVLALLAVVSVIFLMATYGTALPGVPFASVQLNGPTCADSDGELTAVVDTESRRVLVLNDAGELTGVVDCTTIDSPFEAVSDVRISDGRVYVSGMRYVPDSDFVDKERVAVYDKGGNFQGTVFEANGNQSGVTTIKSLSYASGGVVLALQGWNADGEEAPLKQSGADARQVSKLSFVFVGDDDEVKTLGTAATAMGVHDAGYYAETGDYAVLSVRGILNDNGDDASALAFSDHVLTSVDMGAGHMMYVCDDTLDSICSITANGDIEQIASAPGFESVHENSGKLSICNREVNTVKLLASSGEELRSFTEVVPSFGFSLRMAFVWLCGAYLIVLAIVLAVRGLRRRIASGETGSFGPAFASVAVMAAIAVAIGSLSFASYETSRQVRANEIGLCADYLQTRSPSLAEDMQRCNVRGLFKENDAESSAAVQGFFEIYLQVMGLANSATENNIGMYCTLYGKDDAGVFYLFDSADEYVTGTSVSTVGEQDVIVKAFEDPATDDEQLHVGRTLRDATQYRLVKIPTPDRTAVAGVAEIGSRSRSFEASLGARLAQNVLALLVMVLVIYLAYSELRECSRCLMSYGRLQQSQAGDAVAVLTRPFTLSITVLSSIDAVMTVLIARDLLTHASMDGSSPLLAVPAVMLGIGLAVGQVTYGRLGGRVGLRRLIAGGAFAMMLCALITVAVVVLGNFWLYCVAKLLMAIPFGMLSALGYSLPRAAQSDEVRVIAAGGVRRTDTSAAALGTVLGGYAAQALGNAWVYVFVAVACIPVFLLALNLINRGERPLEVLAASATANNDARGRLADFVKSRSALSLVFLVVLPALVAAGYTSFLFPLFSADLGLSKIEINNIYVLGQLVVYVCISSIDKVEASFGRWRTTATAIALLGVVFLLFAINTTLVWSIAVIALIGVLCKSTDGWKAMWLRTAGEAGVGAGKATGAMFASRSMVLVAQPFILGALLGATDSVAVIVIGALCIVCAIAFYLSTRHSPLNR